MKKLEVIKELMVGMLNHIDDHKEGYKKGGWTNENIVNTWIKNHSCQLKILSEIEPDNEKPYLFYEGEKYYFDEEYEFSDDEKDHHPDVAILIGFELHSDFKFETDNCNYKHIRKIDHTSKYKTKLEELKQQAEKDGVNLKELI